MALYPLKFTPRFVEKMWAGRKLESQLGKALPPEKQIGESWEIYDFPPGIVDSSPSWSSSIIANGPLAGTTLHELMQSRAAELLGTTFAQPATSQFPLLVKFLDAREDLSIQVHPDEKYCADHPAAHLKSEAWYVVSAEPGARLFKGLKTGVTRSQYAAAIQSGTSESLLNTVPVSDGDCHYLPSGTVHAIGAGIVVAEVQTPSDTTFRVYDFDRVDVTTGLKRNLHIDQAMECIHFDREENAARSSDPDKLVDCEFFQMSRHRHCAGHRDTLHNDRAAIWIMLSGQAQITVGSMTTPVDLKRGDTVLLPAVMKQPSYLVSQDAEWLKVTF